MTAATANLEIGNFSKRTMLTGAGWTRNWGGRLAAEVWQDLIGHRAIQDNSRLRQLLLEETSFETALGMVEAESFTPADRRTSSNAPSNAATQRFDCGFMFYHDIPAEWIYSVEQIEPLGADSC